MKEHDYNEKFEVGYRLMQVDENMLYLKFKSRKRRLTNNRSDSISILKFISV